MIGVGNRYRRDDGVGPRAIDRLSSGAARAYDAVEESGEAASLVERWSGRSLVVLVDAVRSGAPAGTVNRAEIAQAPPPPARPPASGHSLGVADAIRLASVLGRLPERLIVLTVEVADVDHGTELSAEGRRALERVVAAVRAELSAA